MAKLMFNYIFMEHEYSLEGKEKVTIGRINTNDLVIPNYALFKKLAPDSQRTLINDLTKVSRFHAMLSKHEDNKWYLEDTGSKGLGSNYGTFVNELRLEVKKPYPLNNDDRVKFGPIECIFLEA